MASSLVKNIIQYHNDGDPNTLARLENDLLSFEYSTRYGAFNSACIDVFMMRKCVDTPSFSKWSNELRHQLCHAGIMKVPDWLHSRDGVKNMKMKMATICDNLIF